MESVKKVKCRDCKWSSITSGFLFCHLVDEMEALIGIGREGWPYSIDIYNLSPDCESNCPTYKVKENNNNE